MATAAIRSAVPRPLVKPTAASTPGVNCRRWDVSAVAPVRAEVIILSRIDTPGRIVLADIRNSVARLNSSAGESCSIARSSRNCSTSFISPPPADALSENIRAATATTPTTHGQNRTNRNGRDQHPSAERT